MDETNPSGFKRQAIALAVASCLALAPCFAEAASLGRLTVLSGLGQPLRAEFELGATRDELAGMTARLAPQDVFRQAGVDYAASLRELRFALEKRGNGKPVVKVTSVNPINEPFLDLLVELNWPAGRLVREYTFLLDPPEIAVNQGARTSVSGRVIETVQQRAPQALREAPVKADAKSVSAEDTRVVQRGDTLRKLAAESKYDGVSLEQMLVGLFQKNPDAFIGKNINRLKTGAILSMPEKGAVEAVSEAEAKKVYLTQANDWNAYRRKLAAATAKAAPGDQPASQSSSGKITPAKLQEKEAPAEQGRDQVKVSRTEAAAAGVSGGKAASESEADKVAKDKALTDAQDRLAVLEKNVSELQKLLEMKNQKLAELEQQNSAQKKQEEKPLEPAKPDALPVAAVTPAPEPVATPPDTVKPPAPVPAPIPEPVPPLEALPETDFIDTLLEDPLPLAGGASLLALLTGYFLYKRRRTNNVAVETTAAPGLSSFGPNSVFRMTGGQSVDTGNIPPQTGDFSQTGPGTIDTDEVDPVAEADVYMAYGRDAQAEEILLEALQKDPQRTAIHAKLLEIYANRRSLKQFETLASELYSQTSGIGPEWAKVAALGLGLDPHNPLYSGVQGLTSSAAAAYDSDATLVEVPESALHKMLGLPSGSPLQSPSQDEPVTSIKSPLAESPASALAYDEISLDFDLGAPPSVADLSVEDEPLPVYEPYTSTVVTADPEALDFATDSSLEVVHPETVEELSAQEEMPDEAIDFDLGVAESLDALEYGNTESDFEPVSPEATEAPSAPVAMPFEEPLAEEESSSDIESLLTAAAQLVEQEDAVSSELGAGLLAESSLTLENPEIDEDDFKVSVPDDASLDFDVNLTDSIFLGQPMIPPEFDIGSINLDLATEPPNQNQVAGSTVPPVSEVAADSVPEPSLHDGHWEEVNTKLDLAKAYEEMGDLEGARELLQEVLGEGAADLVEQARTLLARIGE